MKSSSSGMPPVGKLMHVIDTGGPGGAETVFLTLVSRLQGKGHDAIAVVSREGWLADQLRHKGIEPVVLPATVGKLTYLQSLVTTARDEHATAIISHLLGASFYSSLVGLLLNIPVISIFHGQKDVDESRMNWLKGRVLSLVKGRTVFVSAALRSTLQPQLGLRDNRCTVISNGVDVSAFNNVESTLRQRLSIPEESLLVGAVGNIRGPKAYDTLLYAAAETLKQYPDIVFLVAGEGRPPLSDELESLHNRLRLGDRFRFLGLVHNIPEFLAGLDIFIISSRQEGFSIACVEAMAAGLPIIATRSGGPEAIVEDQITGRLVEPDKPSALSEAVLYLASDAATRIRMGSAGRSRAHEHFEISKCIDAYVDLVSQISNAKETPPDVL